VRIVRQVGEALGAAHAAGILHRDVKPSNVLLDEHDMPRLSDFGLALFEGKGELTRSLVGTPEYMAPEQAKDGSKIDARADIFSLAATLYACLTGDAPRVVRESRIPAPLRPALLKALSPRPEDRFATMDAFLRALDSAGGTRARRARVLLALKLVGAAGAAASVISVGFALLKPATEIRPRTTFVSSKPRSDIGKPAIAPPVVAGEVAPTPRIEAGIEQVSIHKTVIDVGYALGFVVNHGATPFERPQARIKFFDDKGTLVLDASGFVAADRLEPGSRFPVKVLLKPHPKYARFEASVEASPVSYTQPSARLEVVEKRLERDRFSGWLLFVKVRNADKVTASFSRISAVLFDPHEEIIGVDEGFAAAQKLAPGEASTAALHVDAYGLEPARFEIYLFGRGER